MNIHVKNSANKFVKTDKNTIFIQSEISMKFFESAEFIFFKCIIFIFILNIFNNIIYIFEIYFEIYFANINEKNIIIFYLYIIYLSLNYN